MNGLNQDQQKVARRGVLRMLRKLLNGSVALMLMGILAFSVIMGAGCSKKNNIAGPNVPQNNDPGDPNNNNNPPGLSFYEEQLVGLWSRYHAYDGSSMYLYFDGDRTACKWEEANGSNHRSSSSSYSNWHVDESNPVGEYKFRVIIDGAGITYTFDYLNDRIWPSSYTNLSYYSSSESKNCQY